MIIIAGTLGVIQMVRNRDFIYNAVLVWAILGIVTKFNEYLPIVIAGVISILAICAVAAWREAKKSLKLK